MTIRNSRARQGFTLVEVMLALAIGATVMVVILAAFRSISTSMAATGHYRDMHHDVRHAMDIMQKEITRSSGVSQCVATNLLTITTIGSNSNAISVAYSLTSNILFRTESGTTNVLATGVSGLLFTLYNASGTQTTTPSDAYFVEINLATRSFGVREAYEDELQARIRMRPKGL